MGSEKIRIEEGQGKVLKFFAISPSATGTQQVLAAAGNNTRIKVVSYCFTLSLSGTNQFHDGTTALTGPFDVLAGGGIAFCGQPSSHLFETGKNAPLNVVATVGIPRGHGSYFTEEG